MAPQRLLLTGATGYMYVQEQQFWLSDKISGGTILDTILKSNNVAVNSLKISALVRGENAAEKIKTFGVEPILFKSLDETDLLRQHASENDVVINTASSWHTAAAEALILGLGDRKKKTGEEVYYIHTSGTSNFGDRPITGDTPRRAYFPTMTIYMDILSTATHLRYMANGQQIWPS